MGEVALAKGLTDKQWSQIKDRLSKGDKAAALAREYGISRQAITNRFSLQAKAVKQVANQIVKAEIEIQSSLQKLEPSLQIDAVNLAQELLSISAHMAGGSRFNAMSFKRLASITHKQVEKLNEDNLDIDKLGEIKALTIMSNDAARIPMELIKANQSLMNESANKKEVFNLDDKVLAAKMAGLLAMAKGRESA